MNSALAAGLALGLMPAAAALGQDLVKEKAAVLRALDKLDGSVVELSVPVGTTVKFRRLSIRVEECVYPRGDIVTGSEVLLEIRDQRDPEPKFRGWMLAESPALSALDHQRYDVWLTSCTSS
ncbi:MAG: DUF2155 domain-containing protein [Paracoccaceae bacterium]